MCCEIRHQKLKRSGLIRLPLLGLFTCEVKLRRGSWYVDYSQLSKLRVQARANGQVSEVL